VYDTACRLIRPIVPDAGLEVEIGASRVAVHIASEEELGLLIGREGQTLASIQYLAARIVARKLGVPVRLQLDAGDYRERQDGKLRSLAMALAERVKATGRPCTTRPLSSYQRRIVHMTLQDDAFVLTRSAGEGPLKRVVIQRAAQAGSTSHVAHMD
jgi:spoIIIJ-associated protein